jgi:hypothetical protein
MYHLFPPHIGGGILLRSRAATRRRGGQAARTFSKLVGQVRARKRVCRARTGRAWRGRTGGARERAHARLADEHTRRKRELLHSGGRSRQRARSRERSARCWGERVHVRARERECPKSSGIRVAHECGAQGGNGDDERGEHRGALSAGVPDACRSSVGYNSGSR